MKNRTVNEQTFESIKQKYSKNNQTPSLSPLKHQTPLTQKENCTPYQKIQFNTTGRTAVNPISPLTIKSFNQPDVSQLKIEEIKNKLKGYQTSKRELMTDRIHSQRTLNKESVPLSKRSIHQPSFNEDFKSGLDPILQTKQKNDPNRSSPIRKYFEVRSKQEGKFQEKISLNEVLREKEAEYKRQREKNNETISSIESIMKNIRAALSETKPTNDC